MAAAAQRLDDDAVRDLLERCGAGDRDACSRLAGLAYDRVVVLAGRMLRRGYDRRRFQRDTADLIQSAALAVWRTLSDQAVRTREPAGFAALIARVVRTTLIKLAERCRNNGGPGAGGHDGEGPDARVSDAWDPELLALWTEFHGTVDRLPDDERQVVDLVFYGGLSTADAAVRLGLSQREVQVRYKCARGRLQDALPGLGRLSA